MITEPKNKGGRPRALNPDADTLKTVEGLGRLQTTTIECAHFLGVSEPTWINFKRDFPEVQAAYDKGLSDGKVSLRRKQIEEALKGNSTMLVWLGKNWLGQTDRVQQEISGPNAGPIEIKSDSPREALSARIDVILARLGAPSADREPDGSAS